METATNPQTGERVVMLGGKWEPIEDSATNERGEKAYLTGGRWITDPGKPKTTKPEGTWEPSGTSALGAIGQGINVGLARTATPMAGFFGGAKLGAMAGVPFGPAGPLIGAGIGSVTGGVLGYLGGEKLAETIGPIRDIPQDVRPLARAGEVIGGSAPIAAAPFMVKRAISEVPKILQPIIQAARQSPGKFTAVEAGSTLGAAQGAAVAELIAPGSPMAGTVGEVAGGFVNPVGAVAKLGGLGAKGFGMVSASFRRSGREAVAAKTIQDAMIKAGEDPQQVARLLNEADLEGIALTAGQKAESPTLLALEATAASKNPDFDALQRARTQENMANLRKLVGQLEASGDPQLLKEAAKMRGRYFDSLIEGRLQGAQARMERTQAMIGGDKATASARATQILDDALDDARKSERALWAEGPKDVPLAGTGIIEAHSKVRSGMLPEEPLPPSFVEAFVARVKDGNGITSGEALRFRSQMLMKARESRGQKKWGDARIYEDMADGALADIATMEGKAASDARAFSKSLHDTFSRTFASDALSVKGTGADRIVPEAVLQRAYGSGGVLANKRFQELESAAKFSGKSMIQEQEDFLRAAATASVDPQTGRVNPRSLEGFLRNNSPMLERFPGLKRDLSTASNAEQAFRDVQAAGERATKAIQQRAVFSEVLKNENPAQAVKNVINSDNPLQSYKQLVKLARRGPDGAVDGLRASTLDYAGRAATSSTGDFSFARYRETLNKPIAGRGPNLMQLMESNGVMSSAEKARMNFILLNAERIERSLASKARMGEVIANPDALFDLVVRAVGANIGGASALGQASGAPIVMAGAGSRIARNLFEKLPRTRVMDVIQEASMNPKFMAKLLEKPRDVRHAQVLQQQINAFLIQAGLTQNEQQ